MALRVVGPVQLDGRLYKNAHAVAASPLVAPPDIPDANRLFVEIVSPMNGVARKAE